MRCLSLKQLKHSQFSPKSLQYISHNEPTRYWVSFVSLSPMTHSCVNKLTTIGSDDGLSRGRRQAIIWTNAGILSIGPLGTNLREIYEFTFTKRHLEISVKWRPFCLGLNVSKYDCYSAAVTTVLSILCATIAVPNRPHAALNHSNVPIAQLDKTWHYIQHNQRQTIISTIDGLLSITWTPNIFP